MEPEASRAAIGAIAALQKRVRDLEDEAAVLKDEHETLLAKMNERDEAYTIRENALNEATEKAKQMLSTASTALIQIREARSERDRLNEQIAETERLIESQNEKIKTRKGACKRVKCDAALLMQRLAEYELILGDIFAPRTPTGSLTSEEISLISSTQSDPNMLPSPLSDVLRNLQRVPKAFTKQSIETKREIVRALLDARSVLTDLNMKMKTLEKQKFSSSTPRKFEVEMKKIALHMRIIANELQKFQFTS